MTSTPRNPLDPRTILFGASERIGRTAFVLGLILLVGLAVAANAVLRWLDSETVVHFLFGFFFYLLFLYMLTAVFVQRLHDLGRSAWVYTAWLCVIVLTLIGVMLAYGGADYFEAYSQFDRKDVIEPAVNEALQSEYRAELERAGPRVTLLLSAIIGGFAALLAFLPGQRAENRYGPPAAHVHAVA